MASEGVPKVQKTMSDTTKVRSLTRKEWTTPGYGEVLPTSVEAVRQDRPPCGGDQLEAMSSSAGDQSGALEGLSRRLHKVPLASDSNEHRRISLLSHAGHCGAVAWLVEWKKRRLSVGHFGVLVRTRFEEVTFSQELRGGELRSVFFGVHLSYFSFPLDPAWWCWRALIWAS